LDKVKFVEVEVIVEKCFEAEEEEEDEGEDIFVYITK
jgi:hypothetical protein